MQASKDHSNSIHESNKEGVQAYAKISGQDWTFYVTRTTINIGRTSEPPPQYPDGYDAQDDEDYVHIDLGPSKLVSRQHVQIYFSTKEETWFLRVKGRNGAKLNAVPFKQGQAIPLESGGVVEVGGIEMMFVLPSETAPLHIADQYLERAGINPAEHNSTANKNQSPSQDVRGQRPVSSGEQSSQGTPRRSALPSGQFQQHIAPAPPDYKRPGTPPSARSNRGAGSSVRSPQYRVAVPGQAGDMDLSLDENQHMKPQYSYAQMITQAIMATPEAKLNLAGIYNFIMDNYAYYRHQQASGWQVRHISRSADGLSLAHACFRTRSDTICR